MQANDDQILTPSEAAELVGVHRRTIYQWLRSGRLHSCQPGGVDGHTGRHFISRAELLALVLPGVDGSVEGVKP